MGDGEGLLPSAPGKKKLDAKRLAELTHDQSVFLDKSLPLEVRYLSIITIKNGIDKYWRKAATKYTITTPGRTK